ncbi:flagellar biosynthetic protein FliO [Nocardioidaceae bacterium]|nr:flagellar biosynthetic protein FliO [Nocardioidaceae bacterium]
MIELLLRLVASLAVVVGLLLVLTRLGARRFSGSSDGLVTVLHRQPLSRTSSLTVVDVAGRVLVLGATEQQISLVTELDAVDLETVTARRVTVPEPRAASSELPAADAAAATTAATTARRAERAPAGALSGSVLSPATWQAAKQALGVRGPAARPTNGAGKRRAEGGRRAS